MLSHTVHRGTTVPHDNIWNLRSQTVLGGSVHSLLYVGPQVYITVRHYKRGRFSPATPHFKTQFIPALPYLGRIPLLICKKRILRASSEM
jgi:hypothetical protein